MGKAMLEELRIQNFAIIDELELNLAAGFNVVTGETGAGKSIIIDALELLLGGKADGGTIRAGAEKAIIEGTFTLDSATRALLTPVLRREELLEGDEAAFVTLAREVRRNGRSSARVNGVAVSNEVLREVGSMLVDIHGQSEHLSLLNARAHLDLTDRYANLIEMRSGLGQVVERLNAVRQEIKLLLSDKKELERRADRLRYDIEQIEAAKLEAGEEEELRAERNRLANSEQLAKLCAEAATLLSGSDTPDAQKSAVDQLMQVSLLLGKLAQIDADLEYEHDLAVQVSEQVQELAIAVRRYGDKVEYNPQRLDEVEERLELIANLRKRYGQDIEAILEYAEKARAELEGIENSDERLEELRGSETKLLKIIGELAQRMSMARVAAGKQLSERVVKELADLRMENTRFEVEVYQEEDPEGCFVLNKRLAFDATGIDRLQFLMSANPGEPLRPLAKVASGGETARIMLGLKRVLAQADQTPTLIFDEIDQGIGGRVGAVVGEKLWTLAHDHQVLCVTHLAQLAGYGDKHYRVSKSSGGGRTLTHVAALNDVERIEELAAMLGTLNESGRQSAKEILAEARARKGEKPNSDKADAEQPRQPTLL
ncbi:MAG: DNA repair protein RecN [Chloroflexi bacterium]|nr:DNA repair protein RecN [Chloroflexota bacterium]